MQEVGKIMRARSRELEISDAEVARRAGLSERRYGNYVTGSRQPDFETFLKICDVLLVTPNDLLLKDTQKLDETEKSIQIQKLISAFKTLSENEAELVVRQVLD